MVQRQADSRSVCPTPLLSFPQYVPCVRVGPLVGCEPGRNIIPSSSLGLEISCFKHPPEGAERRLNQALSPPCSPTLAGHWASHRKPDISGT